MMSQESNIMCSISSGSNKGIEDYLYDCKL